MLYAIISHDGRQYQVQEGQEFDIDFTPEDNGAEIRFDRVLAVRDDNGLKLGQPMLASASVVAEILEPTAGPKLVVQKYRKRKNARRKTGHRQIYTRIKIKQIIAG